MIIILDKIRCHTVNCKQFSYRPSETTAASWVKKIGKKVAIFRQKRFAMGAESFNFAPKCSHTGRFSTPNFAFFDDDFPTGNNFFDNFPTA